jgi:hypothetical protein
MIMQVAHGPLPVENWFHARGESELAQPRLLRAAHVHGNVAAHIRDLAFFEAGNVLARALRWQPADVADQLDDLLTLMATPLASAPEWLRRAAGLSSLHGLTPGQVRGSSGP